MKIFDWSFLLERRIWLAVRFGDRNMKEYITISGFIATRPSTDLQLKLDNNVKLLLKIEELSLTSILGSSYQKCNYTNFSVHSTKEFEKFFCSYFSNVSNSFAVHLQNTNLLMLRCVAYESAF